MVRHVLSDLSEIAALGLFVAMIGFIAKAAGAV